VRVVAIALSFRLPSAQWPVDKPDEARPAPVALIRASNDASRLVNLRGWRGRRIDLRTVRDGERETIAPIEFAPRQESVALAIAIGEHPLNERFPGLSAELVAPSQR
jgi:hypothetical protein